MQVRTFDRVESFDPRSRSFPVLDMFEERELIDRVWHIDTWLNQGVEGACVGFGLTHAMLAEPKPGDKQEYTDEFARKIYHKAQLNDDFQGQEPEQSGTSVRAGLGELKKLGKIKSFRWAFGLKQALLGLCWYGPAVIGSAWTTDMNAADHEGYIYPSGYVMGGHCYIISRYSKDRDAVKIHNSWGKIDWGIEGEAWMKTKAFEKLLMNGGECAFLEKL